MKIIQIHEDDKNYNWKEIPVHCFSLIYDTCTRFPICHSYCSNYSDVVLKTVAIATFDGTTHIREIKKD